jgi:uncharacterized protein (TIGR02588 family)
MKIKIAISLCILLVLLAFISSCVQVANTAPRAELSVLKKELKTDAAGKVTLAITVKNTSTVNAELAGVKVTFYDAQKDLIDSERDSVMNLGSGETWEFNIACAGDNCGAIKSYDIETTAGASAGAY